MDYFECDVPSGDGLCSDNACPCPQVAIPRGQGYLFIEQDLVDFRRMYPGLEDARRAKEQQINRQREALGVQFTAVIRLGPILVCRQGAKLRNLDLEVAGADAKHWWETGQVPLRATPLLGCGEGKAADAVFKPCFSGEDWLRLHSSQGRKKWWQFWK